MSSAGRGALLALDRRIGGARVRDEQLAVRALEAAVALGGARDQATLERALAVRADDLDEVAAVCVVGHAPTVPTPYESAREMRTASIRTSSCGRSLLSFGTLEIVSTTSIPEVTRPKTVCLPSSHEASSAVTMKNCEPFVLGPAFAIASAPRTTRWSFASSSNW